ncbi:sodium/glutamate symporter [Mangrovimicrobium sediminis]|uniref:Sodium/glutamate symporter n=2 Tax=Mangrovimicrobium sediminis TaxID=2562682 RepID=A0A4Z0M319_9GAMM|nr:sodium/glutamate symporter [Haliea sp. SAOS-164]
MDMLSMSIGVLFIGMYLNSRFGFLKRNYIPPAVTGGLVFSVISTLLFLTWQVEFDFDMRFRDLLLLVFFSTVGLSARISQLTNGGRALLYMVAVAAAFLIIQNIVGVGFAYVMDAPLGYGLMAGSISLAGGHGTAAAWAVEAESVGLVRAGEIGLVFATFGLVSGGLLGGPIARLLIGRNDLPTPGKESRDTAPEVADGPVRAGVFADYPLFPVLRALLILALCVSLGDMVNRALADSGLKLPGFLTSMFVAIALTNLGEAFGHPSDLRTIGGFGGVSLHLFLTMSMMTMQLWHLSSLFVPVVLLLALQVLVMTLFATYVVFRVMGADYDAAVLAAGFTGLGLGATPVAIANIEAVTEHYGPSPKSFLVIPLVGAFLIDLLNAGVIKLFIKLIY